MYRNSNTKLNKTSNNSTYIYIHKNKKKIFFTFLHRTLNIFLRGQLYLQISSSPDKQMLRVATEHRPLEWKEKKTANWYRVELHAPRLKRGAGPIKVKGRGRAKTRKLYIFVRFHSFVEPLMHTLEYFSGKTGMQNTRHAHRGRRVL